MFGSNPAWDGNTLRNKSITKLYVKVPSLRVVRGVRFVSKGYLFFTVR
jgi:hypothetical protein